jgi:replicative DNA helicase
MKIAEDRIAEILEVSSQEDIIKKERILAAKHKLAIREEAEKQLKDLSTLQLPDFSNIKAEMMNHMSKIDSAAKNPLPLIDSEFGKHLPLVKGNLVVFAAKAKNGKTSLGTSICKSMLEAKKKILFISNEESHFDIYGRIAGLCTDNFFNAVHRGSSNQISMEIMSKATENIAKYITVVTHEHTPVWTYQGMKNVIEKYGKDFDAIIIDYLSNVSEDVEDPTAEDWKAQERLYNFLNRFKANVPIIAFTQIKQSAKDDESTGSKIEGRKKLKNIVTALIEVVPDKKSNTTLLKLDGLRWAEIDEWYLAFDKGRLHSISEEEYNHRIVSSFVDDSDSTEDDEN